MWRKWLTMLGGLRSFTPRLSQPVVDKSRSNTTTITVEIPDALDPRLADQKYTQPISQLLASKKLGTISEVRQGDANTADEFTRIITVDLSALDLGLDAIAKFLVEREAPPGTLTTIFDHAGNPVDRWILVP